MNQHFDWSFLKGSCLFHIMKSARLLREQDKFSRSICHTFRGQELCKCVSMIPTDTFILRGFPPPILPHRPSRPPRRVDRGTGRGRTHKYCGQVWTRCVRMGHVLDRLWVFILLCLLRDTQRRRHVSLSEITIITMSDTDNSTVSVTHRVRAETTKNQK